MMMNRKTAVRLCALGLGLTGLFFAWSQNQAPAQLTMEKVSANLYMIVGSGGNVAFMPTDEGVLVVDDKFAQDAPQIMQKIRSVTDKPVKYVLNTHQHGDHTGGNEAMRGQKAEIIIHKNARANMVAGKMPGLPDVTFSDETQVFIGGKEVLMKYFGRGHTNGDAMVFFPSEHVVHTGDLFTNGAPFCDASANCSINEWDKTIGKAVQMDFDTVIPGHGPLQKKADLVKYGQTLGSMRDRIRTACAGGAADAAKRLDFKDLGYPTLSPLFSGGVPKMCEELK
jgi:glyoxylase-like metal-dependent hydrolase (beta-lactamase superfamily II)